MRNCIVLGSGRSGTSMMAGCLHGAGYFMGDNLMPANEQNPKGYFESFAIEAINEELLQQVIPARPENWLGRRLFAHRPDKAQRWLAEINGTPTFRVDEPLLARMKHQVKKPPYCFKDPRFSYTLPAWRAVLENPVFLVIFREPGRTANSILNTVSAEPYLHSLRISREKILRVWNAQYRNLIDKERHEGEWLFVHYEQIVNGSGMPRIEGALQAHLDLSFPEKRLKRSADTQDTPVDCQPLYRTLCELAGYAGD